MSQIHNSQSAFDHLKSRFNADAEEFWILTLNSTLTLTNTILISKGTLNYCPVHPRDIFRECLRANAYTFIMAHNHPSRDVEPTIEDIKLTRKIEKLARLLEIPLADHLVFTDTHYSSFREKGLIKSAK